MKKPPTKSAIAKKKKQSARTYGELERNNLRHPVVGVLMGSESDLKWMQESVSALTDFEVPFETKIISAHRTPHALASYASTAASRGIRVIIAGAGGSAHLPGMLAAHTTLPVIGVPCPIGAMMGEDALWSIVQMPKGVPVATVAIGGGWNAGILAAQILAIGDSGSAKSIQQKLEKYKKEMEQLVKKMNEKLTRS